MNRLHKFDKFRFGILDDPSLKTTANDFDFKYIPKDQFEQVIKMVANDRKKEKKKWVDNTPQQALAYRERPNSSFRAKKLNKNNNKHMIKTDKSTVKILTHSVLNNTPEYSPRKKIDSDAPKIRIMSDEEIQRVVENAVREIMVQEDSSHEITVKSMGHNKDEIKPVYSPHFDLESIFNERNINNNTNSVSEFSAIFNENNSYNDYGHEDTQKELIQSVMDENLQTENFLNSFSKSSLNINEDLGVSEKKSSQSIQSVMGEDLQTENLLRSFSKSSLNINEDLRNSDKKSPRWVEAFNDVDENLSIFIDNLDKDSLADDVADEDCMPTGSLRKSHRSVSIHSFSGSSARSIYLQSKGDIEEDEELNHSLEKINEESSKTTLTSFEKKELDTLLGVQPTVRSTETDRHSYESRSIEDEFEEDNEKEINTNFYPVVHIRQPKNGKTTELDKEIDDKDKKSTPVTSRGFNDESLTNSELRLEGGQEKIEKPLYQKKSSRAATPIIPLCNKIPPPSHQLDTSEGSSSKTTTPKSSAVPKPLKNRKSLKSPGTPQDLSPYQVKDMNEENLLIFSKITSYQEKIIGLLDQLRINLLNLTLPDGQPDRIRREHQVVEFTARFSRNYLYQLERMIKDLQLVSKEQYLSRHSNEHRTKVCVIYGILYQATQSYLKQIKYFLLDQTPRKLDVLIRFIVNTTNICIHKNVFDKKDKVVSCLLDRCNCMLGFLQNLKDQRKGAISDRSAKVLKSKIASKFEPPTKSKLSMYEPTVPTARKRKVVKKKKTKKVKEEVKKEPEQPNKPEPEASSSSSPEENITTIDLRKNDLGSLGFNTNESNSNVFSNGVPDFEKEIMTQMEKLTKESANAISPATPNMMSGEDVSIDYFDTGTTKVEDDESEMKARVYEALQKITKQQVHQMLGPLVGNLGSILNNTTTAMDLETLLYDLNSEVVKPTPPGSGTFNRKDNTEEAHNYENSKFLGGEQHTAGSEHRLDLTQSKQRGRALLNRRLDSSSSGEDCDVVVGSSYRTVELRAPNSSPRELPTIEEERWNYPKGEFGAGDPPTSSTQHPSDKKEQQLRYDRNIQFTFVSSEDDFGEPKEKSPGIVDMDFNLPLEELCDHVYYEDQIESKPEADNNAPEVASAKYLEGILEDRLNFIRQIANNPLYVNEFFSQPWKVVTRLTKQIFDQVVDDAVKEISFGEESYLEDFLKMEINLGD